MSEPVNDAQALADALGGRVRVRVPVKNSLVSARKYEALTRGAFKAKGVEIPGGPLPRNAHDTMQCPQGRLEYRRVGNEIEAVWSPER